MLGFGGNRCGDFACSGGGWIRLAAMGAGRDSLPSPQRAPRLEDLAVKIAVAIAVLLAASAAFGQHPKLAPPLGIPVTAERIALGQKLFFDSRLSSDFQTSCSTCHDPAHGFADSNRVAVGSFGRIGTRNSPTIINASFSTLQFHDGRTVDQATQALQPLANRQEMGDQSEAQVLRRLRGIPGYVALFTAAYGVDRRQGTAVTREAFGHAVASFESTIVSFDAPIDRRLAGDSAALSPEAEVGFGIFSQVGCMDCHKPPLFTDLSFHNNGMEFAGKRQANDNGRFDVIRNNRRLSDGQKAQAIRAFKTATLREIGRTAPYNHAGSFTTLRRVLEHYNAGGAKLADQGRPVVDSFIDRRIQPLGLTDRQLDYLEAFLVEGFASPSYPLIERPVLP